VIKKGGFGMEDSGGTGRREGEIRMEDKGLRIQGRQKKK